MWVGTQNGLDRFNPETSKFTIFTTHDGLAGNAVGCILEDGAGHLWMSTNNGVSRFDPADKTFQNYTTDDGLPGLDLTGWGACNRGNSGELYFGGFSGGVAFDPNKVLVKSSSPPIVL